MKRFIQTIQNIFSIEELRNRILLTLGLLLVFRLGSFILLPGIDPARIDSEASKTGLLGLINTFSGGAFSNVSVLGLGIMPYITASIVLQLLTFAVPYYQKLQKEGDSGRKKINNHTRWLTVAIASAQSVGYLATYANDKILSGMDTPAMFFTRIITLVAGTMFCLWLGEKITDKGIGNGVSMLIMIGIISRLPQAFLIEVGDKGAKQSILLILEFLAFFFVILGVVALTQAVRKIPVQYAKQIIGNQTVGGQRQYLPLKVIGAGVMPIIFAQSLMFIPGLISSFFRESEILGTVSNVFNNPMSWQYNTILGLLIIIFTFFYTAISINPRQIADDMKRNGGFIPGVKPGEQTSEYIDNILSRITLPGAICLALIAGFPAIAKAAGIQDDFAYFFGGTSLLIMVGVILDTLQQIESYLLMRHYDGMMKTGKVRGRTQSVSV
ncbi:MAG: preprotein translocase subunit SecY [Cytophagaceae bacterium]|nr:preprotein translocase subunit SecY [Cytophagaceae bacterium]MDW8456730.1 preprotein translocase subunit SecY [Cytophagaceae bacterium]